MHKKADPPRDTTFNDVVRSAREAAGVSVSSVARSINCPPSLVVQIEDGEIALDLDVFIGICRAIGCDPVELFEEGVSKFPTLSDPHGYWTPARVSAIEDGKGLLLLSDLVELATALTMDPVDMFRNAVAQARLSIN